MKIKCIANTTKDFLNINLSINKDISQEVFASTLKKDEVYSVYAMCLYKENIYYLTATTKQDLPYWYPAVLFNVVNTLLPMEWYFDYFPNNDIVAIWGYKEMLDLTHQEGLIKRNIEDMEIFIRNKKKIDDE